MENAFELKNSTTECTKIGRSEIWNQILLKLACIFWLRTHVKYLQLFMLRIPKGKKNATIEGEMQLNTREAGGRFLRNLARTTPLLP